MYCQKKRILNFMMEYGSINPIQALRHLGVFRLAARINDLRADGIAISDEWVDSISSVTEQPVRFKKYLLIME